MDTEHVDPIVIIFLGVLIYLCVVYCTKEGGRAFMLQYTLCEIFMSLFSATLQ